MNEINLLCEYCYNSFSNKSNLKRHKNKYCILRKIKETKLQYEISIVNNKNKINSINYGEEDIYIINKNIIKNNLNDYSILLLVIIELLHFNNHYNIYYPNNKEKLLEIYINNDWFVYDKNNFVLEIIDKYLNIIEDNLYNNTIEYSKINKDNFYNFKKIFTNYYNKFHHFYYNKIKNDEIELLKKKILKLFLSKKYIVKPYYTKKIEF